MVSYYESVGPGNGTGLWHHRRLTEMVELLGVKALVSGVGMPSPGARYEEQ